METLTLADANRLIDGAIAQAAQDGLRMAVAVVDAGGHPIAMARMNGASILAGESVVAKARSAVWLGRPTETAVETGRTWPHVYLSFAIESQGQILLSKGGIPIVRDGAIIGAIGASGGSGDQDVACATAGIAAAGLVGMS